MENFNRLNDLYFKKLLGDKNRKNLTLSFLNAILNKDEREYFTDITFLDKDNEPLTLDGKLSKLDIRADLNDGTQVDIEVQVCPFIQQRRENLMCQLSSFERGVVSMTDYELAMLILTIISVIFTILGYFQKK